MAIEHTVVELSTDPFNPMLNFKAAKEYDELGQSASAVSFYLRTAEYGYESHKYLAYQSLLRMSMCFEDQNDRQHTVSNCILQAIALMPNKPEAYFLMSRFYERQSAWQSCYTYAVLGLEHPSFENLFLDFPGQIGLLFEQAVSAWWIGRQEESIAIFNDLLTRKLPESYRQAINNNLNRINPVG
jgi:hypothetical protein